MLTLNPNGETDCDASFAGAEVTHRTGGLIARVLTANPAERTII